jgi:hypothetical protein
MPLLRAFADVVQRGRGPGNFFSTIPIFERTKPQHFHASDMALLCAYCRSIAMERRAAQALNKGDDKALPRWTQATKAMVTLSMRLRLSPQARAPNNPTRPQPALKPTSYYDRAHEDDA